MYLIRKSMIKKIVLVTILIISVLIVAECMINEKHQAAMEINDTNENKTEFIYLNQNSKKFHRKTCLVFSKNSYMSVNAATEVKRVKAEEYFKPCEICKP